MRSRFHVRFVWNSLLNAPIWKSMKWFTQVSFFTINLKSSLPKSNNMNTTIILIGIIYYRRKTTLMPNMQEGVYSVRQHEKAYARSCKIETVGVSIIWKVFQIKHGQFLILFFLNYALTIFRAYLCAKCKILFDTITVYDKHLESCKNSGNDSIHYDFVDPMKNDKVLAPNSNGYAMVASSSRATS